MESSIIITEHDYRKLVTCLKNARYSSDIPFKAISELGNELKRATKMPSDEVDPDIVTMNSRIIVKDVGSGREFEMTIVYPQDANIAEKRISVLAPIGVALIGTKQGDVIEWEMPAGLKKLQVRAILYQPEAKGRLE